MFIKKKDFNKVFGNKINIQKLIAFLNTISKPQTNINSKRCHYNSNKNKKFGNKYNKEDHCEEIITLLKLH